MIALDSWPGKSKHALVDTEHERVRFGAQHASARIRTHRKKSAVDMVGAPIPPQMPKRLRNTRRSVANRLFLG